MQEPALSMECTLPSDKPIGAPAPFRGDQYPLPVRGKGRGEGFQRRSGEPRADVKRRDASCSRVGGARS